MRQDHRRSPKFAATKRIRHYLLLGSLFSLVLGGSLLIPTARTQHPPRALGLSTHIQCPAYPISSKSPIGLHADVYGTEDGEILKGIVFKWTVSQAAIVSGQGTRNIVLAPSARSGEIKINLEVEGGPPDLTYEASCVLAVNSECAMAPMLDQYSVIAPSEERKYLDRLAQRLKNGPPDSIAYIMSYAGQQACNSESDWRAKRARQYLIESHAIPTSRLVTVNGGFKENWTVELYLRSRADCGPLPNPTLIRTQVRVRGFCDETQLP